MANSDENESEIRMKAVDQTDLDPEVCCGLLLSQIGMDWWYCPFCGDQFEHWVIAKVQGEWR